MSLFSKRTANPFNLSPTTYRNPKDLREILQNLQLALIILLLFVAVIELIMIIELRTEIKMTNEMLSLLPSKK
jgi:hypothetical protein